MWHGPNTTAERQLVRTKEQDIESGEVSKNGHSIILCLVQETIAYIVNRTLSQRTISRDATVDENASNNHYGRAMRLADPRRKVPMES